MQSVNGTILYCVALPLPRPLSLAHALLLPRPTSPSLSLSLLGKTERTFWYVIICLYRLLLPFLLLLLALSLLLSRIWPPKTHTAITLSWVTIARGAFAAYPARGWSHIQGELSRRKALCSSKYLIPNTLYTQNETKPKLKPKQGYESCSRMHISYAR